MAGPRSPVCTFALGRLAFGASLYVAPHSVGRLLVGPEGRGRATGVALRSYGTRDVVIGAGLLRAAVGERDPRPWLDAAIASDCLDVLLQLIDWRVLSPAKRRIGVAAAAGAAVAGILLRRQLDDNGGAPAPAT